jgi:hypothetical protein
LNCCLDWVAIIISQAIPLKDISMTQNRTATTETETEFAWTILLTATTSDGVNVELRHHFIDYPIDEYNDKEKINSRKQSLAKACENFCAEKPALIVSDLIPYSPAE